MMPLPPTLPKAEATALSILQERIDAATDALLRTRDLVIQQIENQLIELQQVRELLPALQQSSAVTESAPTPNLVAVESKTSAPAAPSVVAADPSPSIGQTPDIPLVAAHASHNPAIANSTVFPPMAQARPLLDVTPAQESPLPEIPLVEAEILPPTTLVPSVHLGPATTEELPGLGSPMVEAEPQEETSMVEETAYAAAPSPFHSSPFSANQREDAGGGVAVARPAQTAGGLAVSIPPSLDPALERATLEELNDALARAFAQISGRRSA